MTTERPAAIVELPPESVVNLDVRPILASGGEPLGAILDAIDTVPAGGALKLRAPFKPNPLLRLLGKQGWDHWIEPGEGADWQIWFYKSSL